MQMEGLAPKIRGLACDLCPDEPLGEEGCVASCLYEAAINWRDSDRSKYRQSGFYMYQSSS